MSARLAADIEPALTTLVQSLSTAAHFAGLAHAATLNGWPDVAYNAARCAGRHGLDAIVALHALCAAIESAS